MLSPSHFDFAAVVAHYAPKIALQFSGGRDSLALLLWMRPFWEKVNVYYCNSGDVYPETYELVDRVRQIVPRFIEVPGRAPQIRALYGMPADVIPSSASFPYEVYTKPKKVQGRENCCHKSIMLPLHAAMRADGIRMICRGQRETDEPKSPLRNGDIEDGIALYFPIADWTTQQVESFIVQEGFSLPPYYRSGMTSAPDCMGCTAWLETGAYPYLRKHHPEKAEQVREQIIRLTKHIEADANRMRYIAEAMYG